MALMSPFPNMRCAARGDTVTALSQGSDGGASQIALEQPRLHSGTLVERGLILPGVDPDRPCPALERDGRGRWVDPLRPGG